MKVANQLTNLSTPKVDIIPDTDELRFRIYDPETDEAEARAIFIKRFWLVGVYGAHADAINRGDTQVLDRYVVDEGEGDFYLPEDYAVGCVGIPEEGRPSEKRLLIMFDHFAEVEAC